MVSTIVRNKMSKYMFLAISIIIAFCCVCSKTDQAGKEDNAIDRVPESVYENRSIQDVLTVVAHRQIKELAEGDYIRGTWEQVQNAKQPTGVLWKYPQGVTLYGLLYANEKVLHDPEILDYVKTHNEIISRKFDYLTWQIMTYGKYIHDRATEEYVKLYMLDHCGSMTNQILESVLRHAVTPTPQIHAIFNRVADYVAHKQARLANGTFWRPESREGITLWSDDIYMVCPYLVRWYQYTGDRKFLDDAIHQIIHFASYVQDEDGLWYHGYFFKENEPSPFKWSRANGWVMVGIVEVLSVMPEDHPDREKLLAILKRQIDGLIPHQAESGCWHQVLDHHDLWEETSSTAMFTYGIARAVNRGWIEKDYLRIAEKAFDGINARITADGAILGTCEGTGIKRDLDVYAKRKRPYDDNHAQGAVLLALTELLLAQSLE